jgi:ATP-binding cassette, subfamily B (MDR/TAP), member 1
LQLAVDVIASIRTVASLGREKMFIGQFTAELQPAMIKAKKNTHFRAIVYAIARSIIHFAFAGSLYYGGYLMINKGVLFFNVIR